MTQPTKTLATKMDFANQNHKRTRTQILENLTLTKNRQTQLPRNFAEKRRADFENLA
jgi:hypothetical protein